MKVIHLCQSADPNIGGSLIVARALVQAQNDVGLDAWLVYLYRSDSDLAIQGVNKQLCLGIPRSCRYISGICVLNDLLRQQHPDIIHHHDGLFWPRLATARLNLPLVTHGHLGVCRKKGWFNFSQLIHKYILKHTHRLISISDWVTESWIAAGYPCDKIRLVPNGVDTERFRPKPFKIRNDLLVAENIDPELKILLWVGRLDRHTKGLDRLLRLIKHLPNTWVCLIVGDGPDRNWLANEIRALDRLSNQIVMLGKVDNPETWFGIVDLFIFTSQIEPFGLVLLEAAASELPILSFRCEGGGMELLETLGAQVIGEDELFNLPDILEEYLEVNRNKSYRQLVHQSFSWHSAAQKITDVYRELIGTNS